MEKKYQQTNMAQHNTNRRILASSSLDHPPTRTRPINPPTSNSMDPTLKKRNPKPTSTKNPDPILSSKPFSMSKTINPNHKTTQKPTTKHHRNHHPPCVDIHLQTKSMTASADFDTSKFSFIKPKHENHTKKVTELKGEEFDKVMKVSSAKGLMVVVQDKKKKAEEKTRNEVILQSPGTVKDLVDVKRIPSSVPLIGGGGGGRRRSFCGSQVELVDFLASSGAKVVSVDMPPFMQIHAIDCARKTHDSLEKFTSKALALALKKEFDGVYGPAWHCIVGTSFGSFVTHSVGGFLYFSMDQKLYILLFKTTVQKAD